LEISVNWVWTSRVAVSKNSWLFDSMIPSLESYICFYNLALVLLRVKPRPLRRCIEVLAPAPPNVTLFGRNQVTM
jgi:hypothetical protein